MNAHWPDYHNGVSLGGGFVIEDWMFYRHTGSNLPAILQLPQETHFDQHEWSKSLLATGDLEMAYRTMDCHLRNFYSDADLDAFADFGINAVRMPVGYWVFDDPDLYPKDTWVHLPSGKGEHGVYGVNPDGFITPGTSALTDLVVRLYNRNIKVLLDMHALPGCSSPRQSYAGIYCESSAPNTWAGEAHAGISPGHRVQRADDGKSWSDVARKIALERVVPWIKFIEEHTPGAIIGYELVNEPDLQSRDATAGAVRALSLDLGKEVIHCLGKLAEQVFVGVSTAATNYPTADVAKDYLKSYAPYRLNFVSDVHHYFNWVGCIDYGSKMLSIECVCEANLPGTPHAAEDADWAGWMKEGIFEKGWRFYVGEWSAALSTAHKCQGGVPTREQARKTWQAQKWAYLSQYLHYGGKSQGGKSSFVGDFYWNGRMGYNWNPDPAVCSGGGSDSYAASHYADFGTWDWSLLRLIKLGLAQPLSKLGFTPSALGPKKASACSGKIKVLCDNPGSPPVAGQAGMGPPPPAPAPSSGGPPWFARARSPAAVQSPPASNASHASSATQDKELGTDHSLYTRGCAWIARDNCQDTNVYACKCRMENPQGPCTKCNPMSQPKEDLVKSKPATVATGLAAPIGGSSTVANHSAIGRYTVGCEWIPRDDCKDHNVYACKCRVENPHGPCTSCNPTSHLKVDLHRLNDQRRGPIDVTSVRPHWLVEAAFSILALLSGMVAVIAVRRRTAYHWHGTALHTALQPSGDTSGIYEDMPATA